MHADYQAQIAFHLTGKSAGEGLEAVDTLDLRPALFAGYRDLTRLRYDFPVVLVSSSRDNAFVQSLSGLIDRALAEVGDIEGGRLRKHLLHLEREIRALAAAGASGPLSGLWEQAAKRLGTATDELLEDSLSRAGVSIKVDGEVVDCNEGMPARFLTHAWSTVREQKRRRFCDTVRRLILKLSDILRADFVRSRAGQSAESLKAAVGTAHSGVFDFEVMSRLLAKGAPKESLPAGRRRRVQWALTVLESQRFFPLADGRREPGGGRQPYSFAFDSCAGALEAFRERLPEMVEVAKAIALAEFETEGQYVEGKHDRFFEEFGESTLDAADLSLFPDYLVCVRAGDLGTAEHAELMALLSAGLPVKVLFQIDDILQQSAVGGGRFAFGMGGARIASTAMGLNEAYVLQSASSHLFQYRDRILKGMTYPGPALFSVFSGATRAAARIPTYLVAAAAMQSRAFPAFTFDPSAGPDWASRFCLEGNPQPDLVWSVHGFAYEDAEHQRISEELAFTFVDFVACDRRYTGHFARVPRARWNGGMIPVGECLARETTGPSDKVPYLLLIDRDDVLHRVIVDDKLISEARRCADLWGSLRELGGIHNSHAERLLARERKAWEEQRVGEARRPEPKPAATVAAATAAAPAAAEEPGQERPSDEPYIETPRCTSCDECTQINNRMFVYDANKQAYIADLGAGSYRQLVEAAESCQVSIIHPGKPRNPNEPGLEELLKRAEPFW